MRQKRKDMFSFLKFIQKLLSIQHLLLTFVSGIRLDSGNKKMKQLQPVPSRNILLTGKDTSKNQQPQLK